MSLTYLILGMHPWEYKEINDTVRSMVCEFPKSSFIYLNPQSSIRTLTRTWRTEVKDGYTIWDPPYGLIPTRFGMYRYRNRLTAIRLKDMLNHTLGWDWRSHTVLYVTASTLEQSYDYVKILEPHHLVLDILDDNTHFPNLKKAEQLAYKQKLIELAKRASVVTAVSHYLVEQTETWTGKKVEYLPNGVDVERFQRKGGSREPEDMAPIPHPRLTFVGAITSWIDIELLEAVAASYPDYQLVLVGPVFTSAHAVKQLERRENVHVLGAKPYADVPDYMHASDVLLLPRTYDPHSLACDPLKLYEYLATGKPIVSTGHPSVKRFADLVYIGWDARAFVQAIERALHRTHEWETRQMKVVDQLSWKARAQRLQELVQSTLCTRGSQSEPLFQLNEKA
jgi:glycosyltransferase involved in cell wall biosynthesis